MGKVPKIKHKTASELRVGWNADHERALPAGNSRVYFYVAG